MSDVQVSQAAIGAACDYLTAIIRVHHPNSEPVTKVRDDHPALQAFAHFEQDIISRLATRPALDVEDGAMDELRKIAEQVGEEGDPFAAWEAIDAIIRERDAYKTAVEVLRNIARNTANVVRDLDNYEICIGTVNRVATATIAAIKDATDAGA